MKRSFSSESAPIWRTRFARCWTNISAGKRISQIEKWWAVGRCAALSHPTARPTLRLAPCYGLLVRKLRLEALAKGFEPGQVFFQQVAAGHQSLGGLHIPPLIFV